MDIKSKNTIKLRIFEYREEWENILNLSPSLIEDSADAKFELFSYQILASVQNIVQDTLRNVDSLLDELLILKEETTNKSEMYLGAINIAITKLLSSYQLESILVIIEKARKILKNSSAGNLLELSLWFKSIKTKNSEQLVKEYNEVIKDRIEMIEDTDLYVDYILTLAKQFKGTSLQEDFSKKVEDIMNSIK